MSDNANQKITDEQIKQIIKLSKTEMTQAEIAREVDVPSHRVAYWIYKHKNGVHPKTGKYKKLKIKRQTPATPEVSHVTKPMIALVGTPAEVTATIKELFS